MLSTIDFNNLAGGHAPLGANPQKSASNNSGAAAEVAKPDAVTLQPFHEAQSRKLMNDRVLNAVNNILRDQKLTTVEHLDPEEFTPEKVADRILTFIDSSIQLAGLNGASDEQIEKMRADARRGVEQGFNEAKDILEGFGVFNGKIADDANRTYDLIQYGLDAMEGKVPSAPAAQTVSEPESKVQRAAAPTYHFERGSAVSYERNESFALQVKTQEGDVITVNIANDYDYSASRQVSGGNGYREFSAERSYSESSNYSLSIEGHLSDEEQAALSDLLGQVSKIADHFYNGEGKSAFALAKNMSFDGQQISAFSVDMAYQETRAVSAYRQVEKIQPVANSVSDVPAARDLQLAETDDLAEMQKKVLENLEDGVEEVMGKAAALFPEPSKMVRELFEGIERISQRYEDFQGKHDHGKHLGNDQTSLQKFVDKVLSKMDQPQWLN